MQQENKIVCCICEKLLYQKNKVKGLLKVFKCGWERVCFEVREMIALNAAGYKKGIESAFPSMPKGRQLDNIATAYGLNRRSKQIRLFFWQLIFTESDEKLRKRVLDAYKN